ncbi:MAG: hypothetical protein ACE5I9_02805 [Candidatus Methylomirabilales bacterium]
MKEGRALIPRYTREWTDHNVSDPGIMLLELFAWLTETAIFHLNQVPDTSIEHFLKLVDICREVQNGQREDLEAAIGRAIKALEERHRAVTAAEFEALAIQLASQEQPPVARAKYVGLVDELCEHPVSHPGGPPVMALIIVVPDDPKNDRPTPSQPLTDKIFHELKERSLVTTRLHVIGPEYVEVRVEKETTVVRRPGSGLTKQQIQEAIGRFLHPLTGGPEGKGWPFGRWVYRSELFQLLEGLPYVDHVESLKVTPVSPNGISHAEGIEIPPSALIYAPNRNIYVTVEDLR